MRTFGTMCARVMKVLLALAVLCCGTWASAQQLRIAAASDLNYALHEIAANYEQQTGHKLQVTYGSSGNLTTQILNGAPFDVLLSADTGFPQQLVSAGKADGSSFTLYASGTLVVATNATVPAPSASAPFDVLRSANVTKVAIANPRHAPYGRAAEVALRSAGLFDSISPKFVLGENISHAAQFVQSGNAQAGLLALSLVKSPCAAGLKWVEVPQALYPVMNQGGVIISSSRQKSAAAEFLGYLASPAARGILEKYGFKAPQTGATK